MLLNDRIGAETVNWVSTASDRRCRVGGRRLTGRISELRWVAWMQLHRYVPR